MRLWAMLAALPLLAGAAAVPQFVAVQPEAFAVAGSLSNAWADFDHDGDPDLAVSIIGGGIRLYRNDGGHFTNIGPDAGLPTSGGEVRGLDWGDYDGDGWPDLFAGSAKTDVPSQLFHNDVGARAGGGFHDVAPELGLTLPGRSSRQNNWIDYDNDGDLDLYVTDRFGTNKLFRNDGGIFVQVFADAAPSVAKSTVGACWFDYDRDGWPDLFLANQLGQTDNLFHNDAGKGFTDVAPKLGMEARGRKTSEGGVGCAVADYDNDGALDIFVANYGRNILWHNRGDGTFENVAARAGVDVDNRAVGSAWGDYDNDGRLDLFVTSYVGEPGKQVPVNSLFHNEGNGRFANVIAAYPQLNVGDHGVAWVDVDGDGAIDLSVMRGYTPVGGHFLFRNILPADVRAKSLFVRVEDARGRDTQAGAEVRALGRGGRVLGAQIVATAGGYGSQSIIPLHFAVPPAERLTIEVTFMGAGGRTVQRVTGVRAKDGQGQVLVAKRLP